VISSLLFSPDGLYRLQLGLWTLEKSAISPHCFVKGIPGLPGELYGVRHSRERKKVIE
jgi:hypothetical protein